MIVSNVLHDIFMVILIVCNGTQFRKKQTQSFCPRMPIGPHVAKHVVQTQVGLCSWEDHLIAAWSRVQPRTALGPGEAELYAGMCGISETQGFVHMMHEFKTDDWGIEIERISRDEMHAHVLASPSSAEELRNHLTKLNAY